MTFILTIDFKIKEQQYTNKVIMTSLHQRPVLTEQSILGFAVFVAQVLYHVRVSRMQCVITQVDTFHVYSASHTT